MLSIRQIFTGTFTVIIKLKGNSDSSSTVSLSAISLGICVDHAELNCQIARERAIVTKTKLNLVKHVTTKISIFCTVRAHDAPFNVV